MAVIHSNATIEQIRYQPSPFLRKTKISKSLEVIGLDTEALTSGHCFMICTSEGDTFQPFDYPAFMFTRKYRGKNFVCYNLKYDSGALVQMLTAKQLKELQSDGKTTYENYSIQAIGNKCFSIRKGKNTVHIYDMLNFYKMALEKAASKYLGKHKLDMDANLFTPAYVKKHWKQISAYCVNDAVLVKLLADKLIKQFEEFGVYPRKLYSVAHISWKYFSTYCPHVHVKRYWKKYRQVLDFAMQSYNGGKFEVTRKGSGYFYEYDIVSAYPFEIANLVDTRDARVVESKKYRKSAVFGFIDCTMKIPLNVFSPVAVKRAVLNYYPVGELRKVITKSEYEYLIAVGCDITIHKALWLVKSSITYPYRYEINRLVELKSKFKATGDEMLYHTVKIFLNSLYGKFIQLIPKKGYLKAGNSWNPIYAATITANCRVRMSKLQQTHPEVMAVHTDSVISTAPLNGKGPGKLGDLEFKVEGDGLLLGSGIYQVGDKSRFRGFKTKKKLMDMIPSRGKYINISKLRPYTWREVAHRGLSMDMINRFENMPRKLQVDFDSKRIWLDDYKNFSEVFKRSVDSLPWHTTLMKIN